MKHICANCGESWTEDQIIVGLDSIPDLHQRLDPGGVVPSGECPECFALVYAVSQEVSVAHAHAHAVSSAKKFGGTPEDYLAVHQWLDETKAHIGDWRHRALRHHTLGVFEAEQRFGVMLTRADGVKVPTRPVAERHIMEDCDGRLPTPADWLRKIANPEPWMRASRGGLTEPSETLDHGRLGNLETARTFDHDALVQAEGQRRALGYRR